MDVEAARVLLQVPSYLWGTSEMHLHLAAKEEVHQEHDRVVSRKEEHHPPLQDHTELAA